MMNLINKKTLGSLRLVIGLLSISIILTRTMFSWNPSVPAFYYFTVLSNLFCAGFWIYYGYHKYKLVNPLVHSSITLYMLITNIVFATLIDAVFTETLYTMLFNKEITQTVLHVSMGSSIFTHYVFPFLIGIDFLLFGKHYKLQRKDFFKVVTFPLLYGIMHSFYGIITNNYLYPFLNPSVVGGWPQVVLIMMAILVAMIIVITGLFKLKDVLHRNIALN